MNSDTIRKYRDDFEKKLHHPGAVNDILTIIEKKTHIPRLYLVLGVLTVASIYLIFGYFAELICSVVGFLYPAYMSIKAIESTDKKDDTQWLTYWVIFAVFHVAEFFSDILVGWFPFYWLIKCVVMIYLQSMGAQKLYSSYVRPFVLKYQDAIDGTLKKAKAAGDHVEAEVKRHMN